LSIKPDDSRVTDTTSNEKKEISMTFTRQRSDGPHETQSFTPDANTPQAVETFEAQQVEKRSITSRLTNRPWKNVAIFAIATFAITVPSLMPAQARYYSRYKKSSKARSVQKATRKPAKDAIIGVWGWTKGSQTYLRVRPTTKTPFVAKVPKHTKLYVWGKFNGWYRVETPDNVFGWVNYQYVNAPDDHKLKELSHAKAKVACERSAKTTMFGSVDTLRTYYATYKAPGAKRGLEKMGVEVTPSKPKPQVVVARPKPAPKTSLNFTKATPPVTAPKIFSVPVKSPLMPPAEPGTNVQPASPILIPVENKAPVQPKAVAATPVKAAPKPVKKTERPKVANVPPMKVSNMSPVTAADIMAAREAHLSSRRKTRPTPPVNQTPQKLDQLPAFRDSPDTGDKAVVQPSSSDLFTSPALAAPMLTRSPWNGDAALPAPLCDTDGAIPAFTRVSLKKTPAKATATTSKALPNRGGSPRDYARYMAKKSDFGQGMATQALSYRGRPYIRGAASPRRGFDCSGLVYHLLRQRGYNPPRTSSGLASYGTPVAKDKLQPGDIVLFANTYRGGVSHVGVYLGNSKFVHAANSRAGVRVDPLFSGYYGKKYYGARRVKVKTEKK